MTDNQAQNSTETADINSTELMIHKQYLKDLSFENPNAPAIYNTAEERPAMDMNIAIDVQKLDHVERENFFEVSLKINASATQNNKAMFITDIVYCAAVSITNSDPAKHRPLLFIEVPQLIFPYARQIIANVTNSGAYVPLQLAPFDFRAMYMQRFGKKDDETAETDA